MDSLPSYDTVANANPKVKARSKAERNQAKLAAQQQRVANTKYIFPPDYSVVLYTSNQNRVECLFSKNISDLLKFAPPGLSSAGIKGSIHQIFNLNLTKRFSFLKWLKFKRLITMKVEHLQPLSPGSCSVTILCGYECRKSMIKLHVSPSDYSKIVRTISGLNNISCSMFMV